MLLLPIWMSLASIVLAIGVGSRYGHRLHDRGVTLSGKLRLREAPLIPVCMLAFVALIVVSQAVMSRPSITWRLPLFVEYWLLPFLWALRLMLVTFAASAVTTIAMLGKSKYRFVLLFACTIVVLTVEGATRYASQPRLPELHDWERDGVIIQSSGVTCAPAACANIARSLGVEKTEREMARALQTNWLGTSPSQMVYGMRSLGFSARRVVIPSCDVREVKPPAILSVDHGGQVGGHAVAYMGMEGEHCVIINPNAGRQILSVDMIKKSWRGHAIEISREDDTAS